MLPNRTTFKQQRIEPSISLRFFMQYYWKWKDGKTPLKTSPGIHNNKKKKIARACSSVWFARPRDNGRPSHGANNPTAFEGAAGCLAVEPILRTALHGNHGVSLFFHHFSSLDYCKWIHMDPLWSNTGLQHIPTDVLERSWLLLEVDIVYGQCMGHVRRSVPKCAPWSCKVSWDILPRSAKICQASS